MFDGFTLVICFGESRQEWFVAVYNVGDGRELSFIGGGFAAHPRVALTDTRSWLTDLEDRLSLIERVRSAIGDESAYAGFSSDLTPNTEPSRHRRSRSYASALVSMQMDWYSGHANVLASQSVQCQTAIGELRQIVGAQTGNDELVRNVDAELAPAEPPDAWLARRVVSPSLALPPNAFSKSAT